MIKIIDARFVTTAVQAKGYPRERMPEVAFVGRSNVGKSSMINTLANRKKLVRVSNTPGRTRTLNFFEIELERKEKRHVISLADLPGYGFAKASKTDRTQWQEMIGEYLKSRDELKVVVSIIDAEVGPTEDDHRTLDFLNSQHRKILVVATKIDRLPKAKRKPRLKQLAEQMEVPLEVVVAFSSTDKIGLEDVWEALLSVLIR